MSFLESQDTKRHCDSCRESLIVVSEIWKIKLEYPGSGGLGFLKKGQEYILCKKCFLDSSELLESNIIRKGKRKKGEVMNHE